MLNLTYHWHMTPAPIGPYIYHATGMVNRRKHPLTHEIESRAESQPAKLEIEIISSQCNIGKKIVLLIHGRDMPMLITKKGVPRTRLWTRYIRGH